jgi:putative flavoprotein involved in K+ transport
VTDHDVIVVGAGQAGLGVSYFLRRDGREHVVLERGRIGETWLTQRWDSFTLNTPDFMNVLPGLPHDGQGRETFSRGETLVRYFQRYVREFDLPVRTGVSVISVERSAEHGRFIANVAIDGREPECITGRSIVIASGTQNTPRIPPIRSRVPSELLQLHTATYRNPAALPPGAVVVVGSGQSGCQIAEELLEAGRTVYLCTGKVGRAPRRYRGRELLEWWVDMKVLDVTLASLEDPSISRAAQPQISGRGRHGHTVSLQQLARQGAVILGRLLDIDRGALVVSDEAAANVRFADTISQKLKNDIDAYLARVGIEPPPLEEDPADAPDPGAECASPIRRLDLRDAGIGALIWATGFVADFGWIHLPVLDSEGKPMHRRGISSVPGMYFLGFPWLNSRKSGIIYGVGEDARYIADAIATDPLARAALPTGRTRAKEAANT